MDGTIDLAALIEVCQEFNVSVDGFVPWVRARLAELADANKELTQLRSDFHNLMVESDDHFAI